MNRTGNRKLDNKILNLPVDASTELNECTMVAINSDGYAVVATKVAGLTVAGCVQQYTDNRNGTAGAVTVKVSRGAFVWKNDGTIKSTDILKKCYVSDSQTVTITSTGSSVAGTILAVESDGVTVETI